MEDKKSSLYSLSDKVKNGWTQGSARGWTVTDTPATETPAVRIPEADMHLPQIIAPNEGMPPAVVMPFAAPMPEASRCNPLGMAFTANQNWDETYEPDLGFKRGTIFPQLDFPFIGEGACRYE